MSGIRLVVAVMIGAFIFWPTGAVMFAQVPVPIGRKFFTPLHLDFHGQWRCTDGSSTAQIRVQQHRRDTALGLPWTEVLESQDGVTLHYFVGYDRDRSEFVMVDASDPASIEYGTEGWHGTRLTFESVDRKGQMFPPHHILYEVKSSRQFTVTWEILDDGKWKRDPMFTCNKNNYKP